MNVQPQETAAPAILTQPAEELFRLRQDLVFSPQGAFTVVKDPVGDLFVRLATAELVVAREFDGKSTLDQIEERLAKRNVRVKREKLIAFRDKLQKLQIIVNDAAQVEKKERSLETLSTNKLNKLVVIPLPLKIDPDRLLEWLVRHAAWVFTRTFALASGVLLLLACQVWLERWDEISILLKDTRFSGSKVLGVWAAMSASVALHELAHGFATKIYGGRVRKIGVFLYYFLLIFYTDVSDAWLFRERYKQFMVMAAGAWASVILWSTATVVWRLTIPGSGLNDAAFMFMNVNLAVSTLTLIPLVRSDGYHMLSCVLDIANLREKSFRYTGALLKRTFLRSQEALPEATARERRIYVWYGLVAAPFMAFLFTWSGVRFFSWYLGSFRGWGVLLLAGFTMIRFGIAARIWRALGAKGAGSEDRSGGHQAMIHTAIDKMSTKAKDVASHFTMKKVFAVGAVVALAALPAPIHVSGKFEVINLEATEVRTLIDGVLAEVLVKAGDQVKAGDVVATILDADLVREKSERQAELEQVKARLELFENGYAKEDVEITRIVHEERKKAMVLARAALKRSEEMHAQGYVTEKDLEAARDDFIRKQSLLGQAEQDWLSKSRGFRQEEIREARARVEMLKARIETIEQQLQWTRIIATVPGTVITSDDEIKDQLHRHLERGSGVLKIVDATKLVGRINVPEHELGDVAVGQPVSLRAYQAPDQEITGVIEWIQPSVHRAPNTAATVAVHARFDRPNVPLSIGMTGMAKIDCGSRFAAFLIYRRLLRSFFVELWSWW
jgi:putative peptide zinc metalloprotease protein